MRFWLASPVFLLASLLACPDKDERARTSRAVRPAAVDASTVEACVDRWLAERALDEYGSPQGTMYTGGTPLFDEATGKRTDRLEYVYSHHPDARKVCSGKSPQ